MLTQITMISVYIQEDINMIISFRTLVCTNILLKSITQGNKNTHTHPHTRWLICRYSIEDTWEPDIQGLDTLKVIRSIPSLRVRLSLSTTDNDILIQQVDNKKKKQQKQQQ
jgi:hypothetical protein